ncbi:MAG: helix-turn-helix transcriptional regulator [Coriobacteriaceae bacterium]|nr:helix-turn-helix transcriptional regulator [Coriobacteriaceae bacterium]
MTLGETIRMLRRKRGLTQEQLAEGLCSAVSISRIENDRQAPAASLLDALLGRLGSSVDQLCGVYFQSERDERIDRLFQATEKKLKAASPQEAERLIDAFEREVSSSAVHSQMVLFLRAEALLDQGEDDRSRPLFEESVRATKPSIDLDDFRHELLSVMEAYALGRIVCALSGVDRKREACRLGDELLRCLDSMQTSRSEYAIIKLNLEVNLMSALYSLKRYEESLEMAERAERESIEGQQEVLLPEILFMKARAMGRLGEAVRARAMIRTVIAYMELAGKAEMAAVFRTAAEVELDMAWDGAPDARDALEPAGGA